MYIHILDIIYVSYISKYLYIYVLYIYTMIFNAVLRFFHSKYQASLAWDSNPQNKHAEFKYIQDRSFRVSTK